MSGPLSSNEIEDVVSSVRRLVSVDPRPRPVSRDLGLDRLVLTPALRIVPEAANSPLILTAPVQDDADAPGLDVPTPVLDAAGPQTEAPQTYEAEWEEELWAEPDPPLAELALAVEEAEVVATSASVPEADPLADPAGGGSPWEEVGDDWLTDDSGPSAFADGKMAPQGTRPKADMHKPSGKPSVLDLSAADMLTDADGNPLTVLDEAALQQIIRQLIREELKGVLGERITQSVRKLVRAEINRALAAHALD